MIRKLFLALTLTLLGSAVQASVPDMKFRRLDTRDGLSNSSILCLTRDQKGFVWIGTPYGLNRYDGYRIRTYYSDAKDTTTLRSDYIDAIDVDADGRLWLKQGMNYSLFDPTTEHCDRHPEILMEKMGVKGGIERMFIDSDKDFWVKSYDDGFWHVNMKTKKVHHYPFGYGEQEFNNDIGVSGFAEKDNYLFVTSYNGEVLCFDKKTDRILWKDNYLRQHEGLESVDCKPRADAHGNLWVVTVKVAYVMNLKTRQWHLSAQEALRAWGYQDVPEEWMIWDVMCDSEQRYWIATDHDGVYVADPKDKELRQFLNNKLDESTISDNTLRILYLDQLNRVWIGTYMNGVNLYTSSLSGFQNLELGNINTVCADKQGYWWLGTNDKGIIRYDPKTQEQTVYDKAGYGLRSNTMVSSLTARDGSVWFGTYEGGLIHIKDGHVTNLTATGDTTGLNVNNIWTLCEDQWGNIWLGELGGGMQRIDKRTGRMKSIRMSNSKIPSDYVNKITRTKKGWLLVAHSRYFSMVNPKTMKILNFDASKNIEGLAATEQSITGMEDSRGLLWQGSTSGALIWDMKANHAYLLNMKKGLFGSTVSSIMEDKNHTMWLVTDHGVSNVIVQQQDDGTWHFVVRSYNNRDGLQNGPYNQRSLCYTPDGLILVGGQGGLDVINPKNMGKGRIKEYPMFSGLQLFDEDVAVGEKVDGRVLLDEALDACRELTLRYSDQFTIQLSSSSGEIHNRSRFVYRLEGFNDNWVRTSELNPNITFNSLRAGTYTLCVRMLNDDGTIGDEESQLEITIRPPLWRARWMILLYMLLIGIAAWWWRKWFINKHEQRMKAETLQRETEKIQWMSEMRMKLLEEMRNKGFSVDPSQLTKDSTQSSKLKADGSDINEPTTRFNLQPVDLVPLVRQTCDDFKNESKGQKFKLSFRSMVDELIADLDEEQMKKALTILLTNSVKFSPGNCQISVNLGRSEKRTAMIQVSDNSIGIRDEFKEHAFDPMIGSEGIGLDKVKDIVVAHGGTIRLEDNPGGGTIFIITLPAHEEIVVEEAVLMED